jgi:hypothetical protein
VVGWPDFATVVLMIGSISGRRERPKQFLRGVHYGLMQKPF